MSEMKMEMRSSIKLTPADRRFHLAVAILLILLVLSLLLSVLNGTFSALGFLLAIVLMAGVRERLESSKIPACMKGFPISLVTAGLMAIAFMGFNGLA